MDDFLHNLRSGKLKQPDRGNRGNRNYNDPQFKGTQRRVIDRRNKRDLESFERLNAIKEVLESLSETQKRMAMAYEARTRAEERKAKAMEVLAKNLYKMLNPKADNADELFGFPDSSSLPSQTDTDTTRMEATEAKLIAAPDEEVRDENDYLDEPLGNIDSQKLCDQDRQKIVKITSKLRDEGHSWEKIARHVADQGFPTVSGKGTWRGAMVKTLFEKTEAEANNN
jgi:hypothetical protein